MGGSPTQSPQTLDSTARVLEDLEYIDWILDNYTLKCAGQFDLDQYGRTHERKNQEIGRKISVKSVLPTNGSFDQGATTVQLL